MNKELTSHLADVSKSYNNLKAKAIKGKIPFNLSLFHYIACHSSMMCCRCGITRESIMQDRVNRGAKHGSVFQVVRDNPDDGFSNNNCIPVCFSCNLTSTKN